MSRVTSPKVKLLAEGEVLVAKEMSARSGDLLPKHLASAESAIVIREGACVIHLEESEVVLQQGDVYVIGANVVHQIEATLDFKAVHVMPGDIKFEFFK